MGGATTTFLAFLSFLSFFPPFSFFPSFFGFFDTLELSFAFLEDFFREESKTDDDGALLLIIPDLPFDAMFTFTLGCEIVTEFVPAGVLSWSSLNLDFCNCNCGMIGRVGGSTRNTVLVVAGLGGSLRNTVTNSALAGAATSTAAAASAATAAAAASMSAA